MAIGMITSPPHATTRTMLPVLSSRILLWITKLIGSGSGSFAMSRFSTGKSKLDSVALHYTLLITSSGAPSGVPSIVSRAVTGEYWQRQCPLFFPEVNGHTYSSAKGVTESSVNTWTKGWSLTNTTRLIWVNGYGCNPSLQSLCYPFSISHFLTYE